MISAYIYCPCSEDVRILEDMLRRTLVRFGGEQLALDLNWKGYSRRDNPIGPLEILIFKVESSEDMRGLYALRARYQEADLVIIDETAERPEIYIQPKLSPAGFIGNMLDRRYMEELLSAVIRKIYSERERLQAGMRLEVPCGEERLIILPSQIMYMEARDKSILLHYNCGRILFRDTLKNLKSKLPDTFVRCHRSIIVNYLYVRKIDYAAGRLWLSDSTEIPLSKSYRRSLHKLLKNPVS